MGPLVHPTNRNRFTACPGKIWGFQAFWSCSVDFPHYGDPLAEIGHIWGFWALSGERVEVNVEGRAEAYFRRFVSSAV